jgi:predicted lysophospholipase L1 biosynthesis ABC-type transport system permease subunit
MLLEWTLFFPLENQLMKRHINFLIALILLGCGHIRAQSLIYSLSYGETQASRRIRFPNGGLGVPIFRFAATLAASLGILGLILAVVGVYGVISYAASQRTHEIGIRLALGAQPEQILKMIFRQGFLIVGAGVLAGVLAAAMIARLVGNLLFGVPPGDPVTYAIATSLLAAVALLACYIPASRAMRVDPMVALRHE